MHTDETAGARHERVIWRRTIAATTAATLLGVTGFEMTGALLPQLAGAFATPIPLLAQIPTLVLLSTVICALAAGPLADRVGHRRAILAGVASVALASVGSACAPTGAWLLVAQLVGAPSGALLTGVPLALIGRRFSGTARARGIAITVAGIAGAPAAAVPLMTVLGHVAGWRVAFAALAALALAAIPLLFRGLEPARATATHLQPQPQPQVARGLRGEARALVDALRTTLTQQQVARLLGATAVRAVGWLGMIVFLGALLATRHGWSGAGIGAGYAATGFGYLAGALLAAGPLSPVRWGAGRTYAAATTALAGSLLLVFLLPAGHDAALTITLLAVAVAEAIGWVALSERLCGVVPPALLGTALTLNAAAFDLGAAGGGAWGGLLLAWGDWPLVACGFAAVTLLAVPLAGRMAAAGEPARRPRHAARRAQRA